MRARGYAFAVSDPRSSLAEFLQEFGGEKPLQMPLPDDADLFDRLGIEGDDALDFMDKFAARFAVDVTDYRWYFHHAEEGWNIGGLFFAPPYRRVERVPITTGLLAEAIETKQWPLRYPDHVLPSVRWDIRLNQFVGVLTLGLLALWAGWRLVR